STEKVKEYFYDYVLHEPFTIQTAHATTEHDYVINIPCLKTFKAPNEILKFHVFDFSENYDGLIGVNLMKQLGAVIDVPNGIMRTKFGEIKIHWENSKIKIGPRERKIVRIPVTKNYANIIINHQVIAPPMMSQTPSPSFKHSPQVRPQWPQQTQGRFHVPQISKPPTFNFAKSPGQLEQRRQPRPTPMEVGTITARTQKPTSFQFRSTGKPNWISEELYHQTDDDNLYYEKEHQEEYQYPTEEVQYYEEDLQHLEQTSYDEEEKFYYTGLEEQSGMTKEETYECIKLNANASSKLPHILLPEINAKFLVDTGSSRSMKYNYRCLC
ncbi:hypothetical protein AMK59_7247, partial [Oryctes borbonicus]